MGDIGAVAELATAIFTWATDPNGFHALSLAKKLERLHDASIKALAAKDFQSLDLLLAEYHRLSSEIV